MKKSAVACIGNGFVGGSLTTVLSEKGFDVYVYDKAGKIAAGGKEAWCNRGSNLPNTLKPSADLRKKASSVAELIEACEQDTTFSRIYFVCVPTPMNIDDGSCNTSIVESVLQELSSVPGKRIAVIKSTVPPGSTEQWNKAFEGTGLRIVFCPEFLTEANALDDMRNQTRIVLGGPRPFINAVKQIFQTAFPKVPVIKTSSTTAEMVKYTSNVFLATKVALANELSQICEALDSKGMNIDYDKVIEYATLDPRLGKSHWAVPGPDTKRGFGLSCFPKDINSLMHIAKSLGIEPRVMMGAWEKNLEVRPEKDWELLIDRAVTTKRESNSS